MDPRHARFARNEALFREVNERIAEVSRRHEIGEQLEFLCECGRSDCLAALSLSRSEYEAVRGEPDRFLVAPGHQAAELEEVVVRRKTHLVVRKLGEAGELAAASDPRS